MEIYTFTQAVSNVDFRKAGTMSLKFIRPLYLTPTKL